MRSLYESEPHAKTFEERIELVLSIGFVHSDKDVFLAAWPVRRFQSPPDCWYIAMLAGDMARAWECEPYPLPWIAFERGRGNEKRLSVWPRARIRTLTGRHLVIPA
jgi:hypothetical protein